MTEMGFSLSHFGDALDKPKRSEHYPMNETQPFRNTTSMADRGAGPLPELLVVHSKLFWTYA